MEYFPAVSFPSDCQSSVALQVLTSRCQGRKSCLVRATTREFGDPCYPGTRKYLSVIYTCGEYRPSLCVHQGAALNYQWGILSPFYFNSTEIWGNVLPLSDCSVQQIWLMLLSECNASI